MKKILLVSDGNFSESAFEFARRLNEINPILLTGAFLPRVGYANLWSYSSGAGAPLFIPLAEVADSPETKKNLDRFQTLCRENDIDYRVHKDFSDFALPDLKKETRFADLIILGEPADEDMPFEDEYLKEALEAAECPVVVVPQKMDFPAANILAYDGSESSVYAIKQFAYLFPEFVLNETLLIAVKEEATDILPDEQYIEELAARHFPNLTIAKIEIDPRRYFSTWISEKKKSILVSGSFGRPALSRLFKRSFVSGLIKEVQLPLFITHR